jgi:group I intron endonuclease
MTCGVYRVLNLINGRCYVGSSKNVAKRIRDHRLRLGLGSHANPRLQAGWNKYGEDAFTFEVLEECERDDLEAVEQKYIYEFGAHYPRGGYNIREFAYTNRGIPASAKQRQITRDRLSGVKNPKLSAMLKEPKRASASREKLNSFRRDPEVEQRRVEAIRRAYQNPALRQKIAAAGNGRRFSDEHRARLSEQAKVRERDRRAQGLVAPRGPDGRIISAAKTLSQSSLAPGNALSSMVGAQGGGGGGL